MDEILHVANELSDLIRTVPEKFVQLDADAISYSPGPHKWNKKEILGHLCDSCFNNLQRLVRVQYEDKPFIIYNQDEWVKIQGYQSKSTKELIELWESLHKQFIQILESFPEEKLESIIDTGEEVTARFVIIDYLRHQHHHLNQIFKTHSQKH